MASFFDSMKNKLFILIFAGALVIQSCGPSRFVDPLRKGENAVAASFGGPMVNVPGIATIPLPFTSLTYGRGVTSDLTVYGSWFSTAAIFGTGQFEVGGTYRVWSADENKKGISVSGGFNFGMDRFEKNAKLWPQLDANYYWKYNWRPQTQDDLLVNGSKKANMLYAGLGSWYELAGTRVHDEPQTTRVVPIIQLGHDLNWKSWTFKTELKLIAPFSSNENIVVDYRSLTGRYGATGFYFGFIKRF
jgi:hypothetical protein